MDFVCYCPKLYNLVFHINTVKIAFLYSFDVRMAISPVHG